jgi:hypothetical protein
MNGAVPSLPYMHLWHAQGQLSFTYTAYYLVYLQVEFEVNVSSYYRPCPCWQNMVLAAHLRLLPRLCMCGAYFLFPIAACNMMFKNGDFVFMFVIF